MSLPTLTVQDVVNFKERRPAKDVISLEHSQTVSQALKVLARHKILSAPLVMSPGLEDLSPNGVVEESSSAPTLLGWVDIQDILKALLVTMKKQHPVLPSSMLLLMNCLDTAGKEFSSRTLVTLSGGDDKSLVYETEAQANLLATIKDNLLNNAGVPGRVVHRLALFDPSGQIKHIVSQLDIVRLVATAPETMLGDFAARSLSELGLVRSKGAGEAGLVLVDPHTPTLIALDHMVTAGVSGAAVVSGEGELIANLSISDLRTIQAEHLGVLALPVAEFLALLHGTSYLGYSQRASKQDVGEHPFFAAGRRSMSPASPIKPQHSLSFGCGGSTSHNGALPGSPRLAPPAAAAATAAAAAAGLGPGGPSTAAGGDDDNDDNVDDGVNLITCSPSSTLKEVLTGMAVNNIHRIWVVEPAARPQVTGVVTPTDILSWLLAHFGGAGDTAAVRPSAPTA